MKCVLRFLVLLCGASIFHVGMAGEPFSPKGHNDFWNIVLDMEDLQPTPRILAMMQEGAASFSQPNGGGTAFAKERLPAVFAEQVRRSKEIRPGSPFRIPEIRFFGFYLDAENVDHISAKMQEAFPLAPKVPKEKLVLAFSGIADKDRCTGDLVVFAGNKKEDPPWCLLVVIFDQSGHIVLLDEF